MGGRALAKYGVTRLPAAEYRNRVDRFRQIASRLQRQHDFIYSIPGDVRKDDYGDLDVVFTAKNSSDVVDAFAEVFQSKGRVKNGSTTSLEWELFQVDFNHVAREKFEFASHYYAHGTYAALVGRMARYYHLKFGWNGLYWTNHVNDDRRDTLVTLDWNQAMSMLGYPNTLDPSQTFTQDDLFAHLASSTLMCKEAFRQTKPDRNYGFQEQFFEWIDQQPVTDKLSRAVGWKRLWDFNKSLAVEKANERISMHAGRLYKPVRKVVRKRFIKVKHKLFGNPYLKQ